VACRRAFSLIEILVALAVITVLALPFVEMILTSKRKVEGLPKRLCALYYAQDLMVERLGKTSYVNIRPISKRKMSAFFWNRENVLDTAASETGEKRQRIRSSLDFMDLFDAEVKVTEEIPDKRKRVQVVVGWYEGGHPENVTLNSVAEKS
jgi:prepilin-type N-terminal cleavage/methylation domain-containing protein